MLARIALLAVIVLLSFAFWKMVRIGPGLDGARGW